MARRTDPATSVLATLDALPNTATHQLRALVALRAAGERGLTDHELAALTGLQQTSIGCRRKELRDAGLVAAKDERRPAPSGSLAQVSVAVTD
jgi:transcription initiation factor IIE alpha subunit